jgi:hypothetical protein
VLSGGLKGGVLRTSYEGGKNKTSFLDCFDFGSKITFRVFQGRKALEQISPRRKFKPSPFERARLIFKSCSSVLRVRLPLLSYEF